MNVFLCSSAAFPERYLITKTRIPHLDLHQRRERTKTGDPEHRNEVER